MVKKRSTPKRLPPEKWLAVGITLVNGVPSHVCGGDGRAEAIISGRIRFEDALQDELNRQRTIRDVWLSRTGRPTAYSVLRGDRW
jgi:hypothetical protein